MLIGVNLSANPFKTSLKSRFQSLAGNAYPGGSAARRKRRSLRTGIPSLRLGTRQHEAISEGFI